MAEYFLVSVSHIDMAFVMREEAYEECVEILLERIIGVLERNPQIHFALEQAAHYRKLQKRRLDLFLKVKELLASGRLEFMGGMATTAETNFPNGECLIRNQGMGLIWLQQNLGVTPHAGWLTDTFGLHAQIPQIMNQFGFQHLYANRFGGNKRYDLFHAEGLDGSRVLIIGKDSASVNVFPDSQAFIFCRNWGDIDQLFQEADRLSGNLPKLVTYYIENEEVFSEYYLKLAQDRMEQGDSWKHATYQEYSEAIKQYEQELPVLPGDLNPEFTGTYALRTPIKTENRKAETMLLDAEKWNALLGAGREAEIDECWWDLLFCQFHDAFTGSHEDITMRNLLGKFTGVKNTAIETQKAALQIEEATDSVVCVNSLPWSRKEWVKLDGDLRITVWDGGLKLPQCIRDGCIYFFAEVPAGGMKRYDIKEDMIPTVKEEILDVKKGSQQTKQDISKTKKEIHNEYLRLVLDERNGIESLEDMQGNRYLSEAWDFLSVQEDQGGMQIESCQGAEIYATAGEICISDALSDEMGERILMSGTFPGMRWNSENRLSWEIEFALRRGERALRIKLNLNWRGDKTRIRLRIPCAMEGRDVYHEIPFGVVRREAYRNLPTAKGEWPVQRFAALENGKMGVALINKGVAGVEQEGGTLVTTLIRAYGNGPDAWVRPTALSSQHGEQTFEFMILPYQGNYQTAYVQKVAQEFNQKIESYMGRSSLCQDEMSLFELEGEGIVLSAIKKAWDQSQEVVIRIYESEGKRSKGILRIAGVKEVWSSDMKEEKGSQILCEGERINLELEPFEIKTLRMRL